MVTYYFELEYCEGKADFGKRTGTPGSAEAVVRWLKILYKDRLLTVYHESDTIFVVPFITDYERDE
jgi:hypothetical protein